MAGGRVPGLAGFVMVHCPHIAGVFACRLAPLLPPTTEGLEYSWPRRGGDVAPWPIGRRCRILIETPDRQATFPLTELGERFGVSPEMVRQWIHDGELDAQFLDENVVVVTPLELEEFEYIWGLPIEP